MEAKSGFRPACIMTQKLWKCSGQPTQGGWIYT